MITSKTEADSFKEINSVMESYYLYGAPDTIESKENAYRRTLKWAYVLLGDTRKMVKVSTFDQRAYEVDGYELKEPLVEITDFTFDRWCTLMDL